MHLGLIGYGNIATGLIAYLEDSRVSRITILVRPGSDAQDRHASTHREKAPPVRFVDSVDDLIAAQPDLVVECAGHGAVAAYGPAILGAGHDLVIASLGALADAQLHARIETSAEAGQARMILPSGAIGGLDLLRAIARAGRVDVTYRGIKPPRAWKGSPAETVVDLDRLAEPATFFSGTGRQAALTYPKNANVVAALALAGAGFDDMRVELVADPAAASNQHTYSVASPVCSYSMAIEAQGSAGNARTSVTTVLSILQEIADRFPTVFPGRSLKGP